jgi:hypothetical protein
LKQKTNCTKLAKRGSILPKWQTIRKGRTQSLKPKGRADTAYGGWVAEESILAIILIIEDYYSKAIKNYLNYVKEKC